MAKTKKKLTREEKLAKDRERKRQKYAEIKSNPELYRLQKEKEKERYILRKEKKKIVGIQEMSERAKREQRRRWKKNSQKYIKKVQGQKKLQQILIDDSPPNSEYEAPAEIQASVPKEADPLAIGNKLLETPSTHTNKKQNQSQTSSAVRRIRYRSMKVIGKLREEINKLKKEKDMLRKKKPKTNKPKEDTVEKKVNQIVKDIRADKVEEAKKKLLFTESLNRRLCEKYKTLKKKEKRPFVEGLLQDKSKFKKYRVLSKVPFNLKRKLADSKMGDKQAKIKLQVKDFLEEDVNSQVAPGKNEFVKRGSLKKQKRYLTDNLKNLHNKYCKNWGCISYSTFCKYRPFWIIFPKDQRDTCQCKLHANFELLITALKKANIINEGSGTEILNSLCCDINSRNCLERSCVLCKNKLLNYKEFDDSKDIKYYEWIIEKQTYNGKDGKEHLKKVHTKKKKLDKPREILKKLDTILDLFFKHTRNIVIQYSTIKQLKESLKENEIICHVDFSENFSYKYHEEVQSYHFGGSRGQVSLHTGVLYYLDNLTLQKAKKSFCTMSQCLNHDASAIWAHIIPILNMAQGLVSCLSTIHFLSDSPSSQYRNRYIFYMLTKLKEEVPTLQEVTWNYQESGHGKGAPDGIGAVVKRAADSHVKFGGDVGTFEDFVEVVQRNVRNVALIIITDEEITRPKFPLNIPGFKGTTKVHQAVWTSSLPFSITFRSLSCFDCRGSFLPCKHQKHLGVLSVGIDETVTTQSMSTNTSVAQNHENTDFGAPNKEIIDREFITREEFGFNNENGSALQIDSPTIFNNVAAMQIDSPTIFDNVENMLLSELDGSMLTEEETLSSIPEPVVNMQKSSEIKILSNVSYTYQRFIARKNCKGFSSIDQTEFEKFLQSSKKKEFENIDEDMVVDTNIVNGQEHCMEMDSNIFNKENIVKVGRKYDVDNWVIVEYKIKNKSNYFIGKIAERLENTNEYRVLFLKKAQGKSTKFGWPINSDEDIVPESHIVDHLEEPQENRRGQFIFAKLPKLSLK